MNLLPEENKILFKKHYLRRLSVVFAVLIFSAAGAGIIILMPMYSLILSYKKDLSRESAVYLKKDAELANSPASLEIKKLNSRLDFAEKMSKAKGLNMIFKNRLKKDLGDGKVVSPVSYLINEKDFDFSLILNIKNEK